MYMGLIKGHTIHVVMKITEYPPNVAPPTNQALLRSYSPHQPFLLGLIRLRFFFGWLVLLGYTLFKFDDPLMQIQG